MHEPHSIPGKTGTAPQLSARRWLRRSSVAIMRDAEVSLRGQRQQFAALLTHLDSAAYLLLRSILQANNNDARWEGCSGWRANRGRRKGMSHGMSSVPG